MAYERQYHTNGDVLEARQLNHMETGIKENSDNIDKLSEDIENLTEKIGNDGTVVHEFADSEYEFTGSQNWKSLFKTGAINIVGADNLIVGWDEFNIYGDQKFNCYFYNSKGEQLSNKILGSTETNGVTSYNLTNLIPIDCEYVDITVYSASNASSSGTPTATGDVAYIKGFYVSVYNSELYKKGLETDIYDLKHKDTLTTKYRYLVTTFHGTSADSMILLGTNDLRTFGLVTKKGAYITKKTDSNGKANVLRDPSIIKINEWYYIVYTVAGWSQCSEIGMCRTKDFVIFEELDNIVAPLEPTTNSEYYAIWAPNWFRDGKNIYILMTCRKFASDGETPSGGFDTILVEYNAREHTINNNRLLSLNNRIDAHIHKCNSKYYVVCGGFNIYVGDTLDGTFELIETNNLPKSGYEANFVVRLDCGKWRVYAQQLSDTHGTAHYVYADSLTEDLGGEFGSINVVDYFEDAEKYALSLNSTGTIEFSHWTLFDFYNSNDNNNNFTT